MLQFVCLCSQFMNNDNMMQYQWRNKSNNAYIYPIKMLIVKDVSCGAWIQTEGHVKAVVLGYPGL